VAHTLDQADLRTLLVALRRGPLNWSDADITTIAAGTDLSEPDLRVMRHKMERASQWSVDALSALDAVVARSPHAATLRTRIERSTSIADGIERARTFTGLFGPVKAEIARVEAALRRR
jgi:hypothetical protein